MIRALFFADTPHRLAGSQRSLLGMLPLLRDAGVEPTIVFPFEGMFVDACRAKGVATRVLAAPPAFQMFGRSLTRLSLAGQLNVMARQSFGYARQLARVIDEENADVVHFNGVRGAVMAGAAALIARRPAVMHVHGFAESIERRYWLVAQAFATRFALVSQALRHELLPSLRNRARVVHNGVSIPPLTPRAAARQRVARRWHLDLDRDTPLFLCLSSLLPFKGLHHVIRAAADLKERNVHAQFVLAGEGGGNSYERWLRTQPARQGVTDRVHFVDFVTDTHELLCASDALVLPTVRHESLPLDDGATLRVTGNEGLPLSVLEAMAAERAVIASNLGGVSEEVEHEATGLLVAPGDRHALTAAIHRVAVDAQWRLTAGQRGRAVVATRFTLGRAADGLACLLREAADRRRLSSAVEYAQFCRDGVRWLMCSR